MRSSLRLAWRLNRWELLALGVVGVALSWFAISTAEAMDGVVAGCRAASVVIAPCGGLVEFGEVYDNDLQGTAGMIRQGLAVLPFAAGILLGASMLAREIEHRTAQVAWPLARSRTRWLLLRGLPLLGLAVSLVVAPAMAGEVLARSFYPLLDPAANFEGYGTRGALLVVRLLPALLLGAIVGAWVGRQLAALLLAGVLAAGLGVVLMQLPPYGTAAVEMPGAAFERGHTGSLFQRIEYRDANGNPMSEEDAYALLGSGAEGLPIASQPREVFFVVPGDRYQEVVLRESAALVALSLPMSWLLLAVVRRRRPS